MKIIINAITSKQKAGGGFQISKNFILYAKKNTYTEIDWYYFVSTDLDSEIGFFFQDIKNLKYFVFPTQPDFINTYWHVKIQLNKLLEKINPNLVYSILSPSYFHFKVPEVMRFANAWVTNPTKYSLQKQSFKEGIRNSLYCWNQRRLLRHCKYFITQSKTVAQGLQRISKTEFENVAIVPNVLPACYLLNRNGKEFERISDGFIHIATIAAPVPHKNLDIIPEIIKELKLEYGLNNIIFHVTIPFNNSFLKKFNKQLELLDVSNNVINHGYCKQEQLVNIYRNCTICFLPTLLETFSATLLEAMFFKLYIVASDFMFNREVAEGAALYFEPTNVKDAAFKINQIVTYTKIQEKLRKEMTTILNRYNSYDSHYNAIVSFLKKIADK